jgi:hypothetical protein
MAEGAAQAFSFNPKTWEVSIFGTKASRRHGVWTVDGAVVPQRDIVTEIDFNLDRLCDEQRQLATTILLSPFEGCLLCLGGLYSAKMLSKIGQVASDAPYIELPEFAFNGDALLISEEMDVHVVPASDICIAIADDNGQILRPEGRKVS